MLKWNKKHQQQQQEKINKNLETNFFWENRCKNSQQNTWKPNSRSSYIMSKLVSSQGCRVCSTYIINQFNISNQ